MDRCPKTLGLPCLPSWMTSSWRWRPSYRLELSGLHGQQVDGRGRIEAVGEEDQVRAGGGCGRNQERLEAGLAGQAPKLLGQGPVGDHEVLRLEAELVAGVSPQ